MTLAERRIIWEQRKRERRNKIIKKVCILLVLMFITGLTSFLITNKVKADEDVKLHKYYTTITIGADDTLWSIAKDNILGYKSSKAYIEEVMFINHLTDPDDIRMGAKITIPYYTEDIK